MPEPVNKIPKRQAPAEEVDEHPSDFGSDPGSSAGPIDPVPVELGEWGIDPVVAGSLMSLKTELDKLTDESSEKVLAIEQEYSKLRRPIYDRRAACLLQIPQFWVQALLHHEVLRAYATDDDAAVLQYCTQVNVEDFEDIKSGYKITFDFSENPFFTNSMLSKSYTYEAGGILRIESSLPLWNPEYEPGPGADPSNPKRGRARDYKLIGWFNGETAVTPLAEIDDIAEIIREEIWPDPIHYFDMESEDDLPEDWNSEDVEGEPEDDEQNDDGQEDEEDDQ